MAGWDKVDIVHFLSDRRGYRRYLEICTPSTGHQFAKIVRAKFEVCHRLMYRCPETFHDGLNVDFRTPALDATELFDGLHGQGLRYDVILVDSFHFYDTSYRDLAAALRLLSDGGSIVVHDCLPTREDLVRPDFVPGKPWCGLTFMAYVDFVNRREDLAHLTVDTDYGCGVVRKRGSTRKRPPPEAVMAAWDEAKSDPKAAFRCLTAHKAALLNLVSVEAFKRAELGGIEAAP